MAPISIGLDDIELYIPPPYIPIDRIVEVRGRGNPKLASALERAVSTTGQKGLRFPEEWEDAVTLAANPAWHLFMGNPKSSLANLRYLTTGTETSVDHSKPISAYVEGLLQQSGLDIPSSISSFQVQHACAGATMALLSVSGLLHVSPFQEETGLVICTDIARYQRGSTAEITQGAGSAALLVSKNPKLLDFDIATLGYSSQDVDDFFRPLESKTAVVRGGYSMKCYEKALAEALRDYSRRQGIEPTELLESSDILILHTPFPNMPLRGMKTVLKDLFHMSDTAAEDFLEMRGFSYGTDPVAHIGNIYNGALYLSLAFSLEAHFREKGSEIIGKKVLIASYGSGNTLVVFSGRIAPSAPDVIARWNLSEKVFDNRRDVDISEYLSWMEKSSSQSQIMAMSKNQNIPKNSFYFKGIRKDGYREYGYR